MHHTVTNSSNGALSAPVRNRYFYGKLLDVRSQEREQAYGIHMRRLLNRIGHGAGVLCGLEVRPDGDGKRVLVEPGVAIDGLGREIVVPERREMPDPRRPIDDRGDRCGEPVDSEVVTICLAYAERTEDEGDPARFVRETYTLQVRPGRADPPPRSAAAEAVLAGSPAEAVRDLCGAAAGDACDPPEQCVPIATVDARKGELRVVLCPRPMVAATDVLLELILGLVQRVQELEQGS